MSKLTSRQIEKIKELLQEGKTIAEVARQFNVSRYTIKWHTDENYRKKFRKYKNRWKKRRKYWKRERNYQKNYHKKRYHEDKAFREKQINRAKEYQKRVKF